MMGHKWVLDAPSTFPLQVNISIYQFLGMSASLAHRCNSHWYLSFGMELPLLSQEAIHSHWLADAKCQHLVSTGTTPKNHISFRSRISWVLSWSITSLSSVHFACFPTCHSSKSTLWSTSDHNSPLFPCSQVLNKTLPYTKITLK